MLLNALMNSLESIADVALELAKSPNVRVPSASRRDLPNMCFRILVLLLYGLRLRTSRGDPTKGWSLGQGSPHP